MSGGVFCHLVPIGAVLISWAAAAQDKPVDPGMMMFNNACRTCHTIREGDNRLGPNLYGMIGFGGAVPEELGHSHCGSMAGRLPRGTHSSPE